jgi:hypothetical protein
MQQADSGHLGSSTEQTVPGEALDYASVTADFAMSKFASQQDRTDALLHEVASLRALLRAALPFVQREAAKAPTEHSRMVRQRQAMRALDAIRAALVKEAA